MHGRILQFEIFHLNIDVPSVLQYKPSLSYYIFEYAYTYSRFLLQYEETMHVETYIETYILVAETLVSKREKLVFVHAAVHVTILGLKILLPDGDNRSYNNHPSDK